MTSSTSRHAPWALVLSLVAAVGCGGDDTSTVVEHHGPHGGHTALMSEGAGFEVEFTLDKRRRRMVLYVQESGGPKPHPLAIGSLNGQFVTDRQSVDVTFGADPRSEDPEGRASRFVLALDRLPQQLLASDEFTLKLSLEAGGAPVTASVSHQNDHGHEYNHD